MFNSYLHLSDYVSSTNIVGDLESCISLESTKYSNSALKMQHFEYTQAKSSPIQHKLVGLNSPLSIDTTFTLFG